MLVKEAKEGRRGMPGGLARRKGGQDGGTGSGERVIDVRFPEEAIKAGKEVVRGALEGIVEVGRS